MSACMLHVLAPLYLFLLCHDILLKTGTATCNHLVSNFRLTGRPRSCCTRLIFQLQWLLLDIALRALLPDMNGLSAF